MLHSVTQSNAHDPRADYDGDGMWTVNDYIAFYAAAAIQCNP
jgi:hypothetical protein